MREELSPHEPEGRDAGEVLRDRVPAGSVERFLRRRDFDFAMAVPSLHHRDEPVAGLEAVHRALKPGGRLWIYEGDPEAPLEELRRDRKPLRGWLRMPEWLARKGLRGHGFTVAEVDRTVRPAVAQTSFGTEVARSGSMLRLALARAAP